MATLRTVMGKDCLSIFNLLLFTNDQQSSVKTCLDSLEEYFKLKVNVVHERYLFNSAMQNPGEKIDDFVHRLCELSKNCGYGTMRDDLVCDRMVLGASHNDLRLRMFREKDLTLDKAISMARESETLKHQMKEIRTPTGTQFDSEQSVHLVKKKMGHQKTMKPNNIGSRNICKFCGNQHQLRKKFCLAFGKICKTCKKPNHFVKMCKMKSNKNHGETNQTRKKPIGKRKIYVVEESDYVEEESRSESDNLSDRDIFRVQTIGAVQSTGKNWYAGVKTKIPPTTDTNCEEIRCQIDTRPTCNLISENDCEKVVAGSPVRLKKTKVLLKMYDGSVMKPLGSTVLLCKLGSVKQKI